MRQCHLSSASLFLPGNNFDEWQQFPGLVKSEQTHKAGRIWATLGRILRNQTGTQTVCGPAPFLF